MIILEQTDFEKQIAFVVSALSDAGYDPYAQLTGYLQTSDETFITRKGDARTIIKSLDIKQISEYVMKLKNSDEDL